MDQEEGFSGEPSMRTNLFVASGSSSRIHLKQEEVRGRLRLIAVVLAHDWARIKDCTRKEVAAQANQENATHAA